MNLLKGIKIGDLIWGIFPIVIVLCVIGFVAKEQKLTPLETILLQVIEIVATTISAGYFATRAAEKNSQERAKLALRRIATIYRFFPNFISSIREQEGFLKTQVKNNKVEHGYISQAFSSIISQLYHQINTVNDAVDDWKDLVPDPEKVLKESNKEGGNRDR